MSKTLGLPKKSAEPVYMDAVQRALAEEAALANPAKVANDTSKLAGLADLALANQPSDAKPDDVKEDHPKHADAYMVTKAFTISSPITMSFKQGKVITDPTMIARLLEGKAPIVEVEDINAFLTCPECKHIFKP